MPIQKRVEILGAVSGEEDIFIMAGINSQEVVKRFHRGRVIILHEIECSIDKGDALEALNPERPFAPPIHLRTEIPSSRASWKRAARNQQEQIMELLERGLLQSPGFAVFSFSPIPLAIHFGYTYTDRINISLFHYHRNRGTWAWPKNQETTSKPIKFSVTVHDLAENKHEAVIRISLSARISLKETNPLTSGAQMEIDLFIDDPDAFWLQEPEQLKELSACFLRALKNIRKQMPECRSIHLFYSGPTAGAVKIGQVINSRMNPPVLLYQYDRRLSPRYKHVLILD